jgi:hypothetical protein
MVAIAIAIVAASSGTACQSVQAPSCANLVSAGVAFRGDLTKAVFLFINGADSACTLHAPMISLIGDTGIRLDIPQDWAPMANEQVLQLEAHDVGAIPFVIASMECAQTLRFDHITANFNGGVMVRVPGGGEVCPGSRIRVSAPVAAQMCADGSFGWTFPGGGGRGCPGP